MRFMTGTRITLQLRRLVGTYTFTNGSVKRIATVGDFETDLKALQRKAFNCMEEEYALRNHTVSLAREVAAASDTLLNDQLTCKDSIPHTGPEVMCDEPRRFLWDKQTAKIASCLTGVLLLLNLALVIIGGFINDFGAAYNLYLDPPELASILPAWRPHFAIGSGLGAVGPTALSGAERVLDSSDLAISLGADYLTSLSNYHKEHRIAKLQARKNGIIAGVIILFATFSDGLVTAYMSHRRMRPGEVVKLIISDSPSILEVSDELILCHP